MEGSDDPTGSPGPLDTYATIIKEHLGPSSPDHRYGSCRLVNKAVTDAKSHGERHASFHEARAALSRKEFATLQSVFTRFDEAHAGVLPVLLVHKALKDASLACALKRPGDEAVRWRKLLAASNARTRRRGFFEFDELAVFVSEQPYGIVREPAPRELEEDAKGRAARGAGAGGSSAPEPEFRLEPVESTARSGNPNCAMWSCFPPSCNSCSEDAALQNDEEYSLVFERRPS